jgi:hypothetical protein
LILVGVTAATVTGVVAATVFGVYNEYAAQLPDVGAIEQQQDQFQTVRIYDRTGHEPALRERRPTPLWRRPALRGAGQDDALGLEGGRGAGRSQLLREPRDQRARSAARLCLELAGRRGAGRFVDHPAVDQECGHSVEERAQQSYARKIKEVILAMEVTRRYPKEKLLEWYLNYNFYGNLAYGVEAPARSTLARARAT